MKPPREDTSPRYVAVGDQHYLEESFLMAVNTVGMEVLTRKIGQSDSDRQLLRAINESKKKDVADLVRIEALKRVTSERKGLTLVDVRKLGGIVVASFPSLAPTT